MTSPAGLTASASGSFSARSSRTTSARSPRRSQRCRRAIALRKMTLGCPGCHSSPGGAGRLHHSNGGAHHVRRRPDEGPAWPVNVLSEAFAYSSSQNRNRWRGGRTRRAAADCARPRPRSCCRRRRGGYTSGQRRSPSRGFCKPGSGRERKSRHEAVADPARPAACARRVCVGGKRRAGSVSASARLVRVAPALPRPCLSDRLVRRDRGASDALHDLPCPPRKLRTHSATRPEDGLAPPRLAGHRRRPRRQELGERLLPRGARRALGSACRGAAPGSRSSCESCGRAGRPSSSRRP